MRGRKAAKLIGTGLIVAAVATELRKPASERTWHGRIGGLVPYDFRPPTLERLQAAWWNPDDPRIFTERAFGVGWAVNLGRVARLTREAVA